MPVLSWNSTKIVPSLALALAAPSMAQTIYGLGCGSNLPNSIYAVDSVSGVATSLWAEDLEFCDAAGNGFGATFYAITCDAALYVIDLSQATATPLGYLTSGLNGLAYDPFRDVLYATNYFELYTVDPDTLVATLVGAHNVPTLWAIGYDAFRERLVGYDEASAALQGIDVQTGLATEIGPTGQTRITDLWIDPFSGRTLAARNFPDRLFELDPCAGGATYIADLPASMCALGDYGSPGSGTTYCAPAVPNSSGASGRIVAMGSIVVANNDLVLAAYDLPANQFGYFLVSASQGFTPNPGGSQGNLCIAQPLGRYAQLVQGTTALGVLTIEPDLTALPLTPAVGVSAGQTWHFQCWFRDANPGSTSNFTDATSVVFQ